MPSCYLISYPTVSPLLAGPLLTVDAAELGLQAESSIAAYVSSGIVLLLVATAVALLSRRLGVPYVTGLVLAGLAITDFLPQSIGLDSSLILNLFLPILLFEAAINTDISRLRSTVKPIVLLAGPGVLVAAGVTATILRFGLRLDWIPALLLGTILAITDTVSVIAVFKEITVPSRLITIVEGESLFNDGVALVLFNLILLSHLTGSVSFPEGLQQMVVVIAGGTLVGLALGYLSAGLLARSDDNLSSILLTVALALGAYQVGHWLEVSGVVAVVVAGLMVGNVGLSRRVSASNRVTLYSFWEYAGFGVNTFIFLLVGLELKAVAFWQTLPAVLLAVLAYQVGRLLAVYPLLALVRRVDRPVPLRWQHVLFLGNIKGSLSMALALSLPLTISGRSNLIAIVFGTVLFSLVVQGLSLPWIVKRMRLGVASPARQQTETLRAQLIAAKAAQDELESMLRTGVLPKSIYEEMRSMYQVQVARAERALRDLYDRWAVEVTTGQRDPAGLDAIRKRLLLVEKGALSEALRRGIVSETGAKERLQQIDEKILLLEED
ncbi:MAG: cation:proton antiporter [Leptolyngbya sp. IPPAS B-1204]|uniref:Sodium:proton antiporter n=1 Tax=Leptolyngbya sp. NK1-12 TaxID=2547451 RepID=A0AA96WL33_9CYAN|nr:sodium:proton antiporter [Leptolyngbya sp. NK1-12]MBF2049519.1 sodium:proton antiporter [Elainella sp. C42_A2020_010]RNJ68334.1 MAG: sodium:proton antiporter [Leptolyngbya sp. IPPAS B-1204]WNZ24231.1 sodium:proton antiporter [Leptolyngbya sp. NK1-12]